MMISPEAAVELARHEQAERHRAAARHNLASLVRRMRRAGR